MLKEPHSTALTYEIKVINSIQSPTPLELTWRRRLYRESRPTAAEPFSFLSSFERNYPQTQPTITAFIPSARDAQKVLERAAEDK